MGLGVSLAKQDTYRKFTRYSNSTLFGFLSKNRAKRDLRDQVATKIGEKMHTSRKVAIEQFPYLEMMFQDNERAWELAQYLNLDDAEVKQFRSRKIPVKVRKAALKKEAGLKKAKENQKKSSQENKKASQEKAADKKETSTKTSPKKTSKESPKTRTDSKKKTSKPKPKEASDEKKEAQTSLFKFLKKRKE